MPDQSPFGKHWWWDRIPRFFLIALLVHLALGGLSFTVYLGSDLVAKVSGQVREMLVFTHVSREALQRSRQSSSVRPQELGASDDTPLATPGAPDVEFEPLDARPLSDVPLVEVAPEAPDLPPRTQMTMPLAPEMPEEPLLNREPLPLALDVPDQTEVPAESVPAEPLAAKAPSSEPVAPAPEVSVARATMQPPAAEVSAPRAELAPRNLATSQPLEVPLEPLPNDDMMGASDRLTLQAANANAAAADAIPLEPRAEPGPMPVAAGDEQVAKVEVGVAKASGSDPQQNAARPLATSPVRRPGSQTPGAGRDLTAPLATSSTAATAAMERFGPKASKRLVAQDNIGLSALLQLRQGNAKRDAVLAFGGNDETIAAVERGLKWLAQHQHADGYWSLHEFHKECKGHRCTGEGMVKSDPAGTGLALMAFLGDGHTHQSGNYQDTVKRGLLWMITQQDESGDLAHGVGQNSHMYSHGIATIAICEAYAMTRDEKLADACRRAVDFIVQAQHEPTGGWRYEPNQPADTSVVGWQMMALKSAQMAGLEVPAHTLANVRKWLNSVEGQGDNKGRFGYQKPDSSPAMTAEALLCLEYLEVPRSDPSLIGGIDFLMTRLPAKDQETSYYWYYATQAIYHVQGEPWRKWQEPLRDLLLEGQIRDGHHAGTWDPKDQWEKSAGRVYATSLRLLMLEVYYRHLPLY